MPALILKLRARLRAYRRPIRSISSGAPPSSQLAPSSSSPPPSGVETQVTTDGALAPHFPKKKALVIGICGTGTVSR